MSGKYVVLFSSAVAMLVAALSTLLLFYMQHPEQASLEELTIIQEQVDQLRELADEPVASSAPDTASTATAPVATLPPTTVSTIMAWWYPGEPACTAVEEARTLQLTVAKPEYFVIRDGGRFEFMTEELYGCNGYSQAAVATVQSLAPQQFVMVSASYAPDMDAFLLQDEATGEYTAQLVSFVLENNFTGVELDFEDFGGWTAASYERYKAFVTRLGTALHEEGKQLMLDLPAVRNTTEEAWYQLRLAELEQLPVDYLVIMAYDYQYDHGAGEPITPLDWLAEVVRFTATRVQDDRKIVIGLPSYAYSADTTTGRIRILTYEQATQHPLFAEAVRDGRSQELIAEDPRSVLVYQDEAALQAKIATVGASGIDKVSIWHLGGNPWFR